MCHRTEHVFIVEYDLRISISFLLQLVSEDSLGGIATRYGLEGLRFEPWCRGGGGEILRTHPDRPWSPPSFLYIAYRVSFPGVNQLRRGVDHLPPSSAEVKEIVELYFCSPSGPSWPAVE
jgi:hypothetical protein